MQYLPTRGETDECEPRAGARTRWSIAIVVLGGVLLATAGCTKSVSATVDGETLSFNELEQEALVRYEHCGVGARTDNAMAMCAAGAQVEANFETDEDAMAWLDKVAKYTRGTASRGLGMARVEDADLRAKLLQVCNRLYESEGAWCTSTYSRAP